MWATLKQRIWQFRGIWITAPCVAGVLIGIRFTGGFQLLEWATLDQFFSLRPPEPADSRLVIVTIDETDIDRHGWPLSDASLARVIKQLKQQQPRVIGLDIYRNLPTPPGEAELSKVFASTPNLIGIEKVVANPYGSSVAPPPILAQKGQVGASDLVQDSDGKVRRMMLGLKNAQAQTVDTLATKVALTYLKEEGIEVEVVDADQRRYRLGKAEFTPLQALDGAYVLADEGGYQVLANFRNVRVPFQSISLSDVMAGKIPAGLFRDKIVMVGATAESLGDYFYTSYSSSSFEQAITTTPGVVIHAAFVSQIISAAIAGRPLIRVWSEPVEWLWILLWAVIGSTLGWTLRSPLWTFVSILAAGGTLVGGAYLLFLAGWWVIVVPPLLALMGTAIINKGYVLWDNLNLSYQELAQYSQSLEQKVTDRTLELSQKNAQLQQEICDREQAQAALRESERQLRIQNKVLLELSRNKALYRGDLQIALREITAAAAQTLEIERASVWLYDEKKTSIECFDLFERNVSQHSQGTKLTAVDYPAYFKALKQDWMIVANDARTHPTTIEFTDSYLLPLDITAILDTPIQLGGQMMGILCLEQVGQSHAWTIEEQNFANSMADLVSLAIEAHSRQRAEKALKEAEEKYRSIFENAVEGIFQSTPEGYYLSANPAMARMYGYDSPEALVGQVVDIGKQLYVDSNRQQQFARLIEEQGEIIGFESQVQRQDGKIIWISENARAVRDEWGKLLYYEGIVEDITARKQIEAELRAEQEKSEQLLLNVLPAEIAAQLKQGQGAIATRFDQVTILFSDIVDFTGLAARLSPTDLVNLLNQIFSTFDQLADQYGLEKIKTIGDSYMVVGGLPAPRPDHAEAIAAMALDMQRAINQFRTNEGDFFRLRIGINTGPVVAGVIGIKKFSYDLWGDAVNIASRMETHGAAGKIQVTAATYQLLKHQYQFVKRGTIPIKGRGEMTTYFLLSKRDDHHVDQPT